MFRAFHNSLSLKLSNKYNFIIIMSWVSVYESGNDPACTFTESVSYQKVIDLREAKCFWIATATVLLFVLNSFGLPISALRVMFLSGVRKAGVDSSRLPAGRREWNRLPQASCRQAEASMISRFWIPAGLLCESRGKSILHGSKKGPPGRVNS